jgi:hypothetical protein
VCSLIFVGSTVLSIYFKWWTIFVFWTLCGLMGLLGLFGIVLAIHGIWQSWHLVLDVTRRKGCFSWISPMTSGNRGFTFDDVRSVNVGRNGDGSGEEQTDWFVDLRFREQSPLTLGATAHREHALGYAQRLAKILETGVTERPLSEVE